MACLLKGHTCEAAQDVQARIPPEEMRPTLLFFRGKCTPLKYDWKNNADNLGKLMRFHVRVPPSKGKRRCTVLAARDPSVHELQLGCCRLQRRLVQAGISVVGCNHMHGHAGALSAARPARRSSATS